MALRRSSDIAVDPGTSLILNVTLTVDFNPESNDHPSTYEGRVVISGDFRFYETFSVS